MFLAILRRDLLLSIRGGSGMFQSLIFFALAILTFSLALGPDLALLAKVAAPILWAAAMLSTLLSLDRIFQADAEDGSLDIDWQATDLPVLLVAAKALSHWLTTGLPLIAATPVLALLLNLPAEGLVPLLLSLACGTPALSLIGTFAAAVTLPLRRANILMSVLTAPLFTPVLIFGVSAAESGGHDGSRFLSSILFLSAFSLLSMVSLPFASVWAIKSNLD